MSDRTSWQRAFKAGDAPTVVRALHAAWDELVASSPETFNPDEKEPRLTELLGQHLHDTKAIHKLTGQWTYERRQGQIWRKTANGLRVVKRKRTDIQYFSNREEPVLDLVFEFKKLGHQKSHREHYVGEEGMLRFVTGEYSLRQPLAAMVGILVTHADDSLPPLTQWLNGPDAKALLYMETVDGQQTRSPSSFFPAESLFDTEHLRSREKAPVHGTIVISHIFLGFPGLPHAPEQRGRRQALRDALESQD
jgi:hypothetical protein